MPEKVIKMLHGHFVHVSKTLTDLQILGCELQRNLLDSLAVIRRNGGKGMGRKGLGMWRDGKGLGRE